MVELEGISGVCFATMYLHIQSVRPHAMVAWPVTCPNANQHPHTQLSRQTSVFKNLAIAQAADLALGTVSFCNPKAEGLALSPFQGCACTRTVREAYSHAAAAGCTVSSLMAFSASSPRAATSSR